MSHDKRECEECHRRFRNINKKGLCHHCNMKKLNIIYVGKREFKILDECLKGKRFTSEQNKMVWYGNISRIKSKGIKK